MYANQCQIVLGTNAIEVTREPIIDHVAELFLRENIVRVGVATLNEKAQMMSAPINEQKEWKYRFPSITLLNIDMADGSNFVVELQEVTNQPTWNGGTLADQQQAIDDINAWL